MIYKGEFKTLNNSVCEVEIASSGGTLSPDTLIFTANEPVVIEQQSKSLFAPIKAKQCTIKIVSDHYNFDFYSPYSNGVSVKVKKNNVVIFDGFIEPNIYSQDFTLLDEIELVAIEKISVLKYVDFNPVNENTGGNDTLGNYKIVSFYTLMKNLLYTKCGYTSMIVQQDMKFDEDSTDDVLKNMFINELNFFSDDGEYYEDTSTQAVTFVADATKCDKVLEEILKYLNLSLIVKNNVPVLVNYNAINEGIKTYKQYHFANDTETILNNIGQTFVVDDEDFVDGNVQLSLSEIFTRINVEGNYLDIEDEKICEGIYEKSLLHANPVYQNGKWNDRNSKTFTDILSMSYKGTEYTFYNQFLKFKNKKWRTYNYFFPHYTGMSNQMTPFKRLNPQLYPSSTTAFPMILDTGTFSGSKLDGKENSQYYYRYCMHGFQSGDDDVVGGVNDSVTHSAVDTGSGEIWDDTFYNCGNQTLGASLMKVWARNSTEPTPDKADFVDYMVFGLGLSGCIVERTFSDYEEGWILNNNVQNTLNTLMNYYNTHNVVLAEYESDYSYVFNNKHTNFLVINADIRYDLFWQFSCEKWSGISFAPDYTKEWRAINGQSSSSFFPTLQAEIKIGDKYLYCNWYMDWDTTNNTCTAVVNYYRWQTTPARVYIWADDEGNLNFNKWLKVHNDNNFYMNLSKDGMIIPIEPSDDLRGKLSIKFFTPYLYAQGKEREIHPSNPSTYNVCRNIPRWVNVKDLEISFVAEETDYLELADTEKKDIKFSNVINDGYAVDANEIELSINTQNDNHKGKLSSVISRRWSGSYGWDQENYPYIKSLWSESLGEAAKQEYIIINQQWNHFHTPKKVLQLPLSDTKNYSCQDIIQYPQIPNTDFVVDKMTHFVAEDKVELSLIEF